MANVVDIKNNIETDIIGVIGQQSKERFDKAVEIIETKTSSVNVDGNFKDYQILIYHLNTNTRHGNAYIYNNNSKDEMSKPKITILGEDNLEATKFTESLHLNKWIEVKGKAKRVGERYKSIEIIFES